MSFLDRNKEVSWLHQQIPEWIDKGIITSDAADKIKGLYGDPAPSQPYKLVFILTGILGSILIGGGIIAIFASNWEALNRTWRTILSFAPMVVAMGFYAFTFFRKNDSISWVESTAAFLMLMVAACMALISQTYHIDGTLQEFLFTWMILTIPLMYLTNSSLVTMIYLACVTFWFTERGNDAWIYWGFVAAALPHLWLNIKPKAPSIRGTLLGWTAAISLMVGTFIMLERNDAHVLLGAASMVGVFYLLGKIFYPAGTNMWKRPFQTTAIASMYGMLIMMAFNGQKVRWEELLQWNVSWVILGLAAGLHVFLMVREQKVNYFISLFPLFAIAWLLFSTGESSFFPIVLANLYLLALGIFYVWQGIKGQSMALVNAGMFFIASLILGRFLEGDNFLIKGIAFILIGSGFLGVNIYLNRKLRKKEVSPSQTLA